MCSCYDHNGAVNPSAVKRLVKYLIEQGVQGLYVGGSTGEGMLQTEEERKAVFAAAAEEARGKVTLIAHVGAITTKESAALAVHAKENGADAISAIPPFYFPYTEDDVKRHWQAIMEAAELPFIIYNFPAATGFQVSKPLLAELCRSGQLLGIKTTSYNVYELQQFKETGGPGFHVFSGPDQQYLPSRVMGSSGGIGGTYAAMPELYLRIEQSFQAGRIEEARYWQVAANALSTEFHKYGSLATIKEIIRLRSGIDCGVPRLPIRSLRQEDLGRVRELSQIIEKHALVRAAAISPSEMATS
ncbi:MAG: N-acetylneuraminate lyase [Paenibacillus sp.]|nr:N-acetylneuraminate lyase [Paenibacillus sp.]